MVFGQAKKADRPDASAGGERRRALTTDNGAIVTLCAATAA
jgi:hypothetical protein